MSKAVIEGAKRAGIAKERLLAFADSATAAADIFKLIKDGDLVYVKGSRGIGLEKIIEKLKSGRGNG